MNIFSIKTLLLSIATISVTFFCYPGSTFLKRILRGPSLSRPMEDIIEIKDIIAQNFHTVEKKKLYRSAQLSPEILEQYIKMYRIKTVINLRGAHPTALWWQEEQALCKKLQVTFHNISMSASSMTSKQNLIELLDLYDTAPYPILIHCYGGADRTGEAAALWRLEKQAKSKGQAAKELSLLYGHFQLQYPAKDFLIKIWGGRKWLEHEYNPNDYPQFATSQ